MKYSLAIAILILTSWSSLGQPSTETATSNAPGSAKATAETLDQNYLIRIQVVALGTNRFDLQLVTAKRTFKIHAAKSGITFNGKLAFPKEGQVYLDYELASTPTADESIKRAGNSQANNQMWASGLMSFVIASDLKYNPQQNEAYNGDARPGSRQTLVNASILMLLGKPATILHVDKEEYRISIEKLNDI